MSLDKVENDVQRIKTKVTDELDSSHHAVALELAGKGLEGTEPHLPARGYAAQFTKRDPRQEKLSLYRKAATDWGVGANTGWTANVPSDLVDYYVTKKKHVEYLEWEKWVQDNFNLADPSQVKILKELCPEYFTRRVEHMKKMMDLMFLIAKIDLMGPENKEELFLLYQMQTDAFGNSVAIVSAIAALFRPANETPGAQFKKGMFSVMNWINVRQKKAVGIGAYGVTRAATGNYTIATTGPTGNTAGEPRYIKGDTLTDTAASLANY
jgi:hypothetical protein